jgi:hypothetical protein
MFFRFKKTAETFVAKTKGRRPAPGKNILSKRMLFCFFSLLLMAFMPGMQNRVCGQSTTADILGTITDPTGAVVAGVAVKVTSLSTGEIRTAVSDEHGDYVINALLPAHYKVEVTAAGFKVFQVANLLAAAGDRARVDATLTTGSVTETVEVEAASPLLQTDSSTVATTVVEKSVQDLPLNGRNFVQLAQLTVGANEGPANGLTSGSRPDDRRQSSSISVNGQSDVINNEMIDGADNNERIIGTIGIRPSIDAISEFRVQTNDYTAEAGRTAGGIINIITKSGSNTFHGTLYEYFRNDKLDASNYDFGANLKKSELRQNQFGGSLSGPILKNKTFFFGDFEGLRLVQGITKGTVTVPTVVEEATPGYFGDVIPGLDVSSSVSPIALNWFKLFPAPNTGGANVTSNNYSGTFKRTQNSNLFDVRVDHQITPSDNVYARFSYNGVKTDTPGRLPNVTVDGLNISPGGAVADFAGTANDVAQNSQINYTHLFSPTLLVNALASWLRIDNLSLPLNYGLDADTKFGYDGVNTSTSVSALTPVDITGYANVGDGVFLPINDVDDTYQIAGTATWTHGIQNIKFGASLIRRQAVNDQNNFGVGYLIEQFGATPQANMANFLEGNLDIVLHDTSLDAPHYRTWESGYFIQDDIRLTKRLTLNVGLRYDILTPFTEIQNRISNFNPSGVESNGDAGAIVVASNNDRTAGIATHYTNVAPRLGFADDLGHGLVVRGGFGLSFFPGNYTSNASMKNQPFVSNYTGVYTTLAAGMPAVSAAGTTSTAANPLTVSDNLAPNFRISYLEQFNLLAQKQFGRNVLTVGYVGMLGRHLAEVLNDLNAPLPTHQSTVVSGVNTAVAGTRPWANWGQISQIDTEGVSVYHSMQTAFQRRYANGLAVDVNYTWAHGEDNVTGLSNEGGGGSGASPTTRHTYEWGNSDLDLHHRIAGNAIYQLPFGKTLNGARGLLAKGWQVNALVAWETGLPFSVLNSTDVAGTMPNDSDDDRPNMSGSAKLSHPSKKEWFNTSVFNVQSAGYLGNERRNQLYGPRYEHLDMSLFKDIPVFKDGIVQFRAECFNLTNTPTFANPADSGTNEEIFGNPGVSGANGDNGASATNVAAGFGAISATNANYTPRVFQVALKLQF